jgi:outer membrane lipoprotein carrier protein
VPTRTTGDPNDAAAILRRAAAAWKEVSTLQADFTQRLSVPLMGTEQTSRGRIYHRRPDHFLMRFSDPAGDMLVADGRHAWMYYPSVDRTQVLRSSLTGSGGELDLQREFLDNPTARYVPTVLGEESVGGRPAWALSLVPKGASPYKLVKVWVDRRDALVRRFEMTEENGSVRRLELSNLRTGVELPDSLFEFEPPPGTQVFEQ